MTSSLISWPLRIAVPQPAPTPVHTADAGNFQDVSKVAFNMCNAVTERNVAHLRVQHLAGENAAEPEGCIVFHTLLSAGNEVLRAPDCRMRAIVEVQARPAPVQQSLLGIAATWALHKKRVIGGPRCAPYVVRRCRLQRHSLLDTSLSKEPVVDLLGGLHEGAFATPKPGVGLAIGHMSPHMLRQTVLYPLQFFFALQWASHIHNHIARSRVIFNPAPNPHGKGYGANQELDQVQ